MRGLFVAAALLAASPCRAERSDEELFFEEERRVISASRREQAAHMAPATVYVLSGEELRGSGALTLWDALRRLPGVDVSTIRTGNGAVSIRGLNKSSNNRVLVMIDGRSVLNGYFDNLVWEALPVSLDEIDRIELVAGPASALHGSNAVLGAIDIITKTPEASEGGIARLGYGERRQTVAHYGVGRKTQRGAYRLGAGYRGTRGFQGDLGRPASEVGHVNGRARFALPKELELDVAGGAVQQSVQTSGPAEFSRERGASGFLRADLRRGRTRARGYWNAGRTLLSPLSSLNDPSLTYDTLEFQVEQGLSLPGGHDLIGGGSWRRNVASNALFSNRVVQDNWSLFAEDQWSLWDRWILVSSARADRHAEAGWVLSPRGSLVFAATESQTLRATAGTAFRQPTLLENYTVLIVNTPGTRVEAYGQDELRPERILYYELGHELRQGPWRTQLTGFSYKLRRLIAGTPPAVVSVGPPVVTRVDVTNSGAVSALGGEASLERALWRGAKAWANYSYQSLRDENPSQGTAVSAPKHKVNGGLRLRRGDASAELWGHWTAKTLWRRSAAERIAVPDYALLNAFVGWRLSGPWDGLELGLHAFNLSDNRHREVSGYENATNTGLGGERIGRRWMGTVAYRF